VFIHGLQGHPTKTWESRKPTRTAPDSALDGHSADPPDSISIHSTTESRPSTLTVKKTGRFKAKVERIKSGHSDEHQRENIRGLAGGGMTRTGKGTLKVERRYCFWPRDLLPKECPTARILTWGYDTKVAKFTGGAINKNSVFSHGKDLLFDLQRVKVSGRPIIFVAHSLGGIVVKEMLSASATSETSYLNDIVEQTAAVVFLGTPHRGSVDMSKLGHKARKLVSAALLDSSSATLDILGLRTSDLERCQESFSRLWARYDFRVKTFQEGLGLTGFNIGPLNDKVGVLALLIVPGNDLSLTSQVVPNFSSLLGDAREHAETLQANHREMCRFSGPDDPNCRKVLGELRDIHCSILKAKEPKPTSYRGSFISMHSSSNAERVPDLNNAEEGVYIRSYTESESPKIQLFILDR
jgi:hypothetical protein